MARIDSFLRMVVDQGASDLHFHAGTKPVIRYIGDLVPLPFRKLTEDELQTIKRKIGDYIDWYESMEACIRDRVANE